MLGEFELIERYFSNCGALRPDVVLGVGDDGAVMRVPEGWELVAAVDTLVSGVHFPPDSPPESIGHRALAVNLSDIAAMGAVPAWATLALTLPDVDASWLAGFAAGFGKLAQTHGVALVGGDTTRGALSVTVQVLGVVPAGQAIRRAGGKAGHRLFVSGHPGEAAAGLVIAQRSGAASASQTQAQAQLRSRFEYPTPRVELGLALRPWASACIDVSDGLLADIGKLAAASATGASIDVAQLPLSADLIGELGGSEAMVRALGGGDDYELCFCIAPEKLTAFAAAGICERFSCQVIGALEAQPGVRATRNGTQIRIEGSGFDHFRR